MRSRKAPNADVEIGHRSTTVAHLGNIAFKTGKKLHWNAETEEFTDELSDALASELESLWAKHNTAIDGTTRVEIEYLDVRAVRA